MHREWLRPCFACAFALAAFVGAARGQASPIPATDGIDAILVADTLKGPAGVDAGLRSMESLLSRVRGLGRDVSVATLTGGGVTPGGVLAAIRRLDPRRAANRTILFYYAGHGGTDPGTGHFLRTPAGDLARSTLLAELRAKSPRLTLVLTDCCSTRAVFKAMLPRPPAPLDGRVVDSLLFQHVGVVDVNASSCHPERGVYQAAFYYPGTGGLFTSAFAGMFDRVERLQGDARTLAPQVAELREHRRRFDTSDPADYDRDGDGFIEWSEARDCLDASVMASFEFFRGLARPGGPLRFANAEGLRLLTTQVSQDPQVFGPLAVRSDRPPTTPTAAEPVRRPRLGATFSEKYERGGAYLEVTGVDPRSPASRVFVWKQGRKAKEPASLTSGDTIVTANNARIRSTADLARVLDRVPEGGELNLTGYDASTGRTTKYEATAVLDRFE